nr:MAG TPA_asm: hypothetical protein [Bacteriophage sp.]
MERSRKVKRWTRREYQCAGKDRNELRWRCVGLLSEGKDKG